MAHLNKNLRLSRCFQKHKKNNSHFMSKTLHALLVILTISFANTSMAQTKKVPTKTDTTKVKKDNFLDLGAGTLGGIFGENLDGQSKNKKLSFLELLEKMDVPTEQKAEYKNWYYLQSKNLTEKQKDSLGKAIEKKIIEAQKDN